MRQGFLFLILLMGLAGGTGWAVGGDMGVGTEPLTNGSVTYPWLIEDVDDFDAFAGNSAYWTSGVYTQLMTDIDLAGRTYTTAVIAPDTTEDSVFQGVKFSGRFYGNDHVISNLNISAATGYYIALFGCTDHGFIYRVKLNNFNITGYDYVGGLCGKNWYSSIARCDTTCIVSGNSYVGGLCGENSFGTNIRDSYASGSVTGNSSVGSFCGHNSGTIDSCFAAGVATGNSSVGGFCGSNSGSVTKCYATGTVSGSGTTSSFVGGFCGQNNGAINLCYSTGAVINSGMYLDVAGGFCGANASDIHQCYSTGAVAGNNYIGGLCGASLSGSITDSFWDMQTSGLSFSSGGTGKTTTQMQTISTFTEAGWDFFEDNYPDWMILREGEDYPRLAWQEIFVGDIAGLYGVDMVDFAYLSQYWGLDDCNGLDDCGRADIDDSGNVGMPDFAKVAADWLK